MNLTNVQEGSFLTIPNTSAFSVFNQGTFRVVRSLTNTFWIQNSNAIEQTVVLNVNSDFQFYDVNSVLPGDTIVLNGNLMGASNNGTYTVSQVGSQSLTISGSFNTTFAGTALGANIDGLQSFDAAPATFFKQIQTVGNISTISNTFTDILLADTQGGGKLAGKISSANGFTFTALNKLGFSQLQTFGINGYSNYTGLIQQATQVVFGNPQSPTLYPGVKSAGSNIDIIPPLPREIAVSVAVRLRTGVSINNILSNIQTTVAGVINGTNIGQSISISDIIKAVSLIDGILSVSIISPTYSSSSDLITVYPGQKAICYPTVDVSVSVLSS
jgi:hypothetical protein